MLSLLRKFFSYRSARVEAGNKDTSRPSAIIVHKHCFKNAGTTIDTALRNNFGEQFVDHRDNNAMNSGGTSYLKQFFLDNPKVRALSSHHLALPLPEIPGIRFFLLMMYRHPLERVTSAYHFEQIQTHADTLGAKFARDHSLSEYIHWRMRLDVPPTIRNFHVTNSLPTPARWNRLLDESDLAEAKRFAEALPLLGIVDRFEESMVLFEETLRPVFPDINLAVAPQNVRQDRSATPKLRIEQLHNEIGQELFDLLAEQNRLDLELYAHAQELFLARLGRIEDLDRKLQAFRERR